jgi:DNA-binding beta-propeller fold protein YncE
MSQLLGSPKRAIVGLWVALAIFVLAACGGFPRVQGEDQSSVAGYRVVRDVGLPGSSSRWDYQVDDPAAGRLYIAHLGASQIVVFDTRRDRVVHVINGISSVHGLALAPDLGRLFASATGENRVVGIDTNTLLPVASATTGDYPDGIAYAGNSGRLFVSDEQGTGDTVLEAQTMHPLGDVQLGGDIGNSYYDPSTQVIYVAVGSDNRLMAVDARTLKVINQSPLPGCQGAHGLQIGHLPYRRAFVACEGNAQLIALNLGGSRIESRFSVGETPDVLALDTGLHRLYVASESGQLTVFDTGGAIRMLAEGNAGPNAHSVAVDPKTHIIYLPLADVGGRSVLRELAPG